MREQARGTTDVVVPTITSPAAKAPAGDPPASTAAKASSPKGAAAPAGKTPSRQRPAAPVGKAAAKAASKAASASASAETSRGNKLSLIEVEPPAPDHNERMTKLGAVGEEAAGCTKCGLCETRTKVVFARGNARHRVMFIGEAPGADEDVQGLPFVGRAGKLLDQIIDATGFTRDEIYVANILKCRPPKNRDPKPEEIEACTPYLEAQIELVAPRVICALGKFASQFLTGNPKATMGQLRGKVHHYRGKVPVLPTYHPAALLRNPNWKRVVWEDMQVLRDVYLAAQSEHSG